MCSASVNSGLTHGYTRETITSTFNLHLVTLKHDCSIIHDLYFQPVHKIPDTIVSGVKKGDFACFPIRVHFLFVRFITVTFAPTSTLRRNFISWPKLNDVIHIHNKFA